MLFKAVEDFRSAIQKQDLTLPAAVQLHEILIGDTLEVLPAKRILVWPDGPLWFLPFQALRRQSEGPYLIESHIVSYVSGAGKSSRQTAPVITRQPTNLLVVADPDGSLPLARSEADAICGRAKLNRASRLVGKDATLLKIAGILDQADMVHFASHAKYNPEYPNFSWLQLHNNDRLYSLNLGNLEFTGKHVFMNACETQMGNEVPGEGIHGIASAFIAAGAACLITTLWPIHSEASALFAEQYYEQLWEGRPVDEVLTLVARSFIQGTCQNGDLASETRLDRPIYWAAFNMMVS